jgi:hypothetical protein
LFLVQDGHQTSGQIGEALQRECVRGVIWSPGDETPDFLAERTDATSGFDDVVQAIDPQFYVALLQDSNPKRLPRHEIFGMKLRGGAFSAKRLGRTVKRILDYQRGFRVTHLLSPTVAIAGMTDRSAQIALNLAETSIELLDELAEAEEEDRPMFLSVAVEQFVLNDEDSVNGLLDELTTYDVPGFYLLFEINPELEGGRQAALLTESLYIVHTLARIQGKEVWVGYAGLTGYLYRAVGASAFAAGGFRKQQWWSPGHWKAGTGGGRGGPRPRIYLETLLGSLLAETELATIRSQRSDLLLGPDLIAGPGGLAGAYREGTASEPDRRTCAAQLFDVCAELDARITGDLLADIARVRTDIAAAADFHERISAAGVQLEGRSDATQIGIWGQAIDAFLRRAEIEFP